MPFTIDYQGDKGPANLTDLAKMMCVYNEGGRMLTDQELHRLGIVFNAF